MAEGAGVAVGVMVGVPVGVMVGVTVGAGGQAVAARVVMPWGSCTIVLGRMMAMLGQNQQVPGRFLFWQQLNLRL